MQDTVYNSRIMIIDLVRVCQWLGEVRVIAAGAMYATIETDDIQRTQLTKRGIWHTRD